MFLSTVHVCFCMPETFSRGKGRQPATKYRSCQESWEAPFVPVRAQVSHSVGFAGMAAGEFAWRVTETQISPSKGSIPFSPQVCFNAKSNRVCILYLSFVNDFLMFILEMSNEIRLGSYLIDSTSQS